MRKIDLPISGRSETYSIAPSKIIALGQNYLAHIAEEDKVRVGSFKKEIPKEPILFPKAPSALIGPEESIVLPAFLERCGFDEVRTHYEAELAFIIKERCKNLQPEQVYDYILGFTCANDVSQRNIQGGDKSGWFRGKSLDTFAPVGPVLVLAEDIPDPQSLRIQCRRNGETVQDGNTADMIFSIPEMLAYITMNFTLEPGDLILTGTPAGVGEICDGDVIEVEVEGIGVLRNPVVAE